MNTVSVTEPLAPLRLKKNEERRLRAGHLWVYSNEVDIAATPLKAFAPGQQVQLLAHSGKSLGNAYVNPNSLICARLVSRDARFLLDRSLLVHRLNVALALRERLFDRPFYRLVYGEADQLPGLVIDRYDEVCVVQCTTAGMEAVKEQVLEALDKVLRPSGILWRADSPVRKLEGLDSYRDVHGVVPDQTDIVEHGVRFSVSLLEGQKTGWFYDQRMNRARLRDYVPGRRVLDVFSYVGAWGVQAAAAGAGAVVCVDGSENAV
ncbi:MAG: class I SAM-dependent methyltransferase, partial [Thiogranum sp.]